MLFDAKAATEKLGAIPPPTWGSDDHKHNPSFIAVNDDIVRDEQGP